MSLTKVTYSMILGAPNSALDTGASSDGVTNNTAAVQATLDLVDNVDGAVAVTGPNVRVGVDTTGLYANVIPFANLTWPYNAEVQYQGTTWESVSLKNQFSNPYQAVPVTTDAWAPSTAYVYGQKRVNGGNCYFCIGSGTSAPSGGPTGTGSSITDGTVTWKYVVNGYFGPVPVNEWRFHAPYHPGIVLDNLTSASYGGVTQPAQQIGADIGATGNPDTSRFKSIIFSQDNDLHWQIVSDGFLSDLSLNHANLSGTAYPFRMYFTGDYGDVGVQINPNINNVGETSYPLMVAGAMKLLVDDRVDDSVVTYTNQIRFTGMPSFKIGYQNDTVNNVATVQLEGATGYVLGLNAPNPTGQGSSVSMSASDGSGNTYSALFDGFYKAHLPGTDGVLALGRAARRWTRLHLTPVTVGSLPSAASAAAGCMAIVNDATATTFASIVAGGGANTVPVYSDGTNWRIG